LGALSRQTVMAGPVTAIHGFTMAKQDVDDRHQGGHDTAGLGALSRQTVMAGLGPAIHGFNNKKTSPRPVEQHDRFHHFWRQAGAGDDLV
jgi:hypothetical protein